MIIKYNSLVLKYEDKWLNSDVTPTPPSLFEEVTIGTQTWMKTNLAIDDGLGGIYIKDNVTSEGINFGTQYYYNWWAANRVAESIEGWHLPSEAEWTTLINYVGHSTASAKLKSTYGWYTSYGYYRGNGTDDYGFCILPVGIKHNKEEPLAGSDYSPAGQVAYYWVLPNNPEPVNYLELRFECGNDGSPHSGSGARWGEMGLSVRLIKDT